MYFWLFLQIYPDTLDWFRVRNIKMVSFCSDPVINSFFFHLIGKELKWKKMRKYVDM